MRNPLFLALGLGLLLVSAPSPAQQQLSEWNQPIRPFRIAGNVYYAGTASIAAYLISDPGGHVLIDGAMEESVDQIAANIDSLGFRIEDVRYILSTHAHWDHAGGLTAPKRRSGADLAASADDSQALETGWIDYRNDVGTFAPVAVDRRVADGDRVSVGNTSLTARLTPGHTRGCTSWTMTTRVHGRSLDVIFACSLSVAGQPLVNSVGYPTAARDFAQTFDRLAGLRADIFLGSHTSSFRFEEKLSRLQAGDPLAFVDPGELPTQVARARAAFEQEMIAQTDANERGRAAPQNLEAASRQPPASSNRATPEAIELAVRHAMERTGARGLALAVIEDGRPVLVRSWGHRNAAGDPLTNDTIMYGASLTKSVFAYIVMQLVEEGRIALDRSIADYLPRPLPEYAHDEHNYAPWHHLAGDERWRRLTPRILLSHRSGFNNFAFVEPDGHLRFHFDPGSRYAYSGEGLILLQFVLERGLGLDLGAEMQRRVFDRFAMTNTSMMWRADFARNLADGWMIDGRVEPHDERSRVRAAGSMDTSIADLARFAAGFMRGEGLHPTSRAEMLRSQQPIRSNAQFPSLAPEPETQRWPGLGAGLGVVTFEGPQGRGFFKGGHNDSTGNFWVCLERGRRCVVLLANDVRAEAAFQGIAELILGQTGLPWAWEYPQF